MSNDKLVKCRCQNLRRQKILDTNTSLNSVSGIDLSLSGTSDHKAAISH